MPTSEHRMIYTVEIAFANAAEIPAHVIEQMIYDQLGDPLNDEAEPLLCTFVAVLKVRDNGQ